MTGLITGLSHDPSTNNPNHINPINCTRRLVYGCVGDCWIDSITGVTEMTTISLHEHIHRCNVYLRVALPKARQEDAAGRLKLSCYATSCGTMGCVGYHYADAMGALDELKQQEHVLDNAINDWLVDGDHNGTWYSTFEMTGAFDTGRVSLDEREEQVRDVLAEYEAQIDA